MDLILWRHAEAAIESPEQDDLERPLTSKGERQAQRMAEWLNRHLAHSTRVLVSPAAALPADGPGTRPQVPNRYCAGACCRGGGAAGGGALAGRQRAGARRRHQPTLGLVASLAVTGTAQPWSVKKGAVWWLRSRSRDEGERVVLQAVQGPDTL
jgi:phosphohistidine phosphatase